MSIYEFLQFFLTVVSYFFFHMSFFSFCAKIKGEKIGCISWFVNFFITYTWFLITALFGIPLVVNWFVFLLIWGAQIYKTFSFNLMESYSLSLFCINTGLAINIFFRNVVALILNRPLSEFDNSMPSLRGYPVSLGFGCMAVLLYILSRKGFAEKLEGMFRYRKSTDFYFRTELIVFIFLNAQFMMYSHPINKVGIKVWGIKSALFTWGVLGITMVYTLRVATLHYYIQKQSENQYRLTKESSDADRLWDLAYTDTLTGCNNRLLLDKRLEEYSEYGGSITLAFIDVNGLKFINDKYGHGEGDQYLINVAKVLSAYAKKCKADLFRYGGDEFIIMSNAISEKEAEDILISANEQIKAKSDEGFYSISYGVTHGPCSDYKSLINQADKKMYYQKQQYRKRRLPD